MVSQELGLKLEGLTYSFFDCAKRAGSTDAKAVFFKTNDAYGLRIEFVGDT